ncbi:hypothetical protein DFH28DRAFT_457558 [Melampsora americana]|nr:hypothetical protein DFH28DRAFT_457558 [Melampsora americana]
MSSLNEVQKEECIQSFLSITQSDRPELAKSTLESVNWNLDLALSTFFDSKITSVSNQTNPSQSNLNLNLNDSKEIDQFNSNHPLDSKKIKKTFDPIQQNQKRSRWSGVLIRLWTGPLRFLTLPVSLLTDLTLTLVDMLARLVGLRLPSSLLYWSRARSNRSTNPTDPRSCADRWIRELEEEIRGTDSFGHSTQVQISSSISTSRNGLSSAPDLRLPDFLRVGYDEAVRKAKEEIKILMVVLVSEEHDDVAEFKRTTLTNEELLKTIRTHDILVWGGDVRDRDACQAARNLDVTTYPSIVFVALQTRQPTLGNRYGVSTTRNGTSTQPIMTLIARLGGSCKSGTSAKTVMKMITETVVPRTQGFLEHLRAEKHQRISERRLREEQDRAYAEAGRKDQERVLAKKAELEAQAKKEQEEAQRILVMNEKRGKKMREEEKRERWRRWASKALVSEEPDEGSEGVLKIGFRLGNGKRIVRRFLKKDSLKSLYIFVEIQSTLGKKVERDEEIKEEEGKFEKEDEHEFRFKLSTAMPRRVLPLDDRMRIEDFGGLDGANLNVEGSLDGSDDESEEEEEEEEKAD